MCLNKVNIVFLDIKLGTSYMTVFFKKSEDVLFSYFFNLATQHPHLLVNIIALLVISRSSFLSSIQIEIFLHSVNKNL